MKRIKIMGLCAVAVFAMAAVLAGSASAAPVFKVCEKTPKTEPATGEYSGKTCANATAEAGGKYRLGAFSKAKKTAFTIKGGKGANYGWLPFEFNGKGEIVGDSFPGTKLSATECASEKGKGIYSETGATFKVEYKGCKDGSKNCKTEVAPPGKGKSGVIVDEELTGTMVDLPGGRVGLDLHAVKPGGPLAQYNCEGLEIKATGGVIGEIEGATTEAAKAPKFNFVHNQNGEVQQQWLYPSTTLSEAEQAEDAYQYTNEIFTTGKATAPEPTQLYSIVSGESEGTIPSQQGSKSETKGEALKIVG